MRARKWLVLMLVSAGFMACSAGAQASILDGVRDFLFGAPQRKAERVEDVRGELSRLSEEMAALGIGRLQDEKIDAMVKDYAAIPEQYRDGIDFTHEVLYAIGMGDFDYDTGDWKPSSHRVYAFDSEVFDMNHMYTNFLKGVSAINRGEFDLTDVEEDVSQADWDTNTGTQTIRFLYDGHAYEYPAKFQGDWLDMGVVAFMNGVFKAEGNPKRLYCFGDQVQIMFYDTPDWAARFTEATGEPLSDAPFQ